MSDHLALLSMVPAYHGTTATASVCHLAALAMHYRDEPLGYDLLNEPIPHFPELVSLNPSLEPLYKNLSSELRKVDAHHILFLGGEQWDGKFRFSGNLSMRTSRTRSTNIGWTAPDESVLKQYIDFRERFDVPIWMGESGENTDQWIAQFVQAFEKKQHRLGFLAVQKDGRVVSDCQYSPTRRSGENRGVRETSAGRCARARTAEGAA